MNKGAMLSSTWPKRVSTKATTSGEVKSTSLCTVASTSLPISRLSSALMGSAVSPPTSDHSCSSRSCRTGSTLVPMRNVPYSISDSFSAAASAKRGSCSNRSSQSQHVSCGGAPRSWPRGPAPPRCACRAPFPCSWCRSPPGRRGGPGSGRKGRVAAPVRPGL